MDILKIYITGFPVFSSNELLFRAASMCFGIKESELIVKREYGKKPYFSSHPEIHFSVSHSGNTWAVVFAPYEVGLDIQTGGTKISQERVAKRYFHPHEYELFESGYDFYSIWTRKEAVCKLLGYGIDKRFAMTDTFSCDFTVKEISLPDHSELYAAIAYESDFSYSVIQF